MNNKKTPKMIHKTKTRALGYTSLIRKLKTMRIKKFGISETAMTDPATTEKAKIDPTEGETDMTIEDMVVTVTQQPAIDWAGEWSDEEVTSVNARNFEIGSLLLLSQLFEEMEFCVCGTVYSVAERFRI